MNFDPQPCFGNYYRTTTQSTLRPFNGIFSGTTWVNRYQKGETGLDLSEARDDGVLGRQWYQLYHMQTICTSLRTDNYITHCLQARLLFLTPNQQCQSSEGLRNKTKFANGGIYGFNPCIFCMWKSENSPLISVSMNIPVVACQIVAGTVVQGRYRQPVLAHGPWTPTVCSGNSCLTSRVGKSIAR